MHYHAPVQVKLQEALSNGAYSFSLAVEAPPK